MAKNSSLSQFQIIPLPVEIEPLVSEFTLTSDTSILTDDPNGENALYLQRLLKIPTGYTLPIRFLDAEGTNVIRLVSDHSRNDLGESGYQLVIQPESIDIHALESAGIFYGIQTLRQLLPVEIEFRKLVPQRQWIIPGVKITDKPRFRWRGFMLDEGRHIHGKENLFRTLDLMALQKLNILHWHLTEDQGWRIEIKRYPKLTEIGSQRAGTAENLVDMFRDKHDGIPHTGYYAQHEIREIVQYASSRHITIVPEIEIPGHSLAALAAYPQFSCTGGPFEVATRFGIHNDIYCPGKEATFEFLLNILEEVLDLFPSPHIHIGGDEAPKTRWRRCSDCQRRIVEEGLKDEHALQTYMINRIGSYLESRGRRLMGWNQILQDGLSREALVQYWIGNKKGIIKAVREGQQVVNSSFLETYLDHSYKLTPLNRAYHFDPVFPEVEGEQLRNIIGLEAPLWTEWIPNSDRLDFQTYPRLTALAETAWTPKSHKDYGDFQIRLTHFLRRLNVLGVRYAPKSDWDPPWFRRLFGAFTILQPQRKVSPN